MEISILAYFSVYGINKQSKQLILKSNICKTADSIKTVMVKLKKNNLIYKDDFDGRVCVTNALKTSSSSSSILLKIDVNP